MACLAETALRRAYTRHAWTLIPSNSPARVWRLDGPSALYVKIAPAAGELDAGGGPRAEAERLAWLSKHDIAAPEPLDTGIIDDAEYLVSRAAPGRPASDDWPADQLDAVIDAVADAAQKLHAVPVADCPFDQSLVPTVELARRRAAAGLIDADGLSAARRGWDTTRRLDALDAALAAAPAAEPPVLCHGDFCLPNVLIDPDTLRATAIVDVGRFGRADRYADLALMARSIVHPRLNPQYGPGHAARFLKTYGADGADDARVHLYQLLTEFF